VSIQRLCRKQICLEALNSILLYINMAQVHLPQRLLRFFAKYPPKLYSAKYTGASIPLTKSIPQTPALQAAESPVQATSEVPVASNTSSEDPDVSTIETTTAVPKPVPRSERGPPNPFLPMKNHETGRWRGAAIGLRVQADLVKLAKKNGVEALLPPGRKSTAFKEQRTLERGLRVRGTGEGQKVKGHKWERRMGAKLDVRRKAMENMPEMIREWKQRGHGRGWKKYPK
jgi:large subunit ribosomal protein L25